MKEDKKSRKGTIITIGENQRKRIPQVFDTIFKIVQTPVTDNEDLENDDTFRLHTLRTIDVEGVTVIPGRKAVNVNGDFDIDLEEDSDLEDKDLVNKVFADKEEAIAAWGYLTKLQLDKAESLRAKIEETVNMLRTSLDDRQY